MLTMQSACACMRAAQAGAWQLHRCPCTCVSSDKDSFSWFVWAAMGNTQVRMNCLTVKHTHTDTQTNSLFLALPASGFYTRPCIRENRGPNSHCELFIIFITLLLFWEFSLTWFYYSVIRWWVLSCSLYSFFFILSQIYWPGPNVEKQRWKQAGTGLISTPHSVVKLCNSPSASPVFFPTSVSLKLTTLGKKSSSWKNKSFFFKLNAMHWNEALLQGHRTSKAIWLQHLNISHCMNKQSYTCSSCARFFRPIWI